jgi:exodeoxyribonuclease VII large subunit
VVSAIGHESDSPILDLVADHRASTPTDAAKRVVPDVADEKARVRQARQRMIQAISGLVGRQQELLNALRSRPVLLDPTATFDRRYEQLAELKHRAHRAVAQQSNANRRWSGTNSPECAQCHRRPRLSAVTRFCSIGTARLFDQSIRSRLARI